MEKSKHSYLILDGHQALGTKFWVECFDTDAEECFLKTVKDECVQFLSDFETRFSRFKEDSLLSKMNKGEDVQFDQDFKNMLSFGEVLESRSEGVFSLYIGNSLGDKGYGKRMRYVNTTQKSEVRVHDQVMRLEGEESLDFGGVGKGYAIDKLSEILVSNGLYFYIINGGGDIYGTARKNGDPLCVYLEHPLEEGVVIGSVFIKNQGFAASSSFKRSWKKEGKEVNHFIRKNNKEDVWAAIFVVADNCLIADSCATALLLQTKKQRENLSQLYHAGYFFFSDQGVEKNTTFPAVYEA